VLKYYRNRAYSTIFFANYHPESDLLIHGRPLASYAFIKIKLESCHLLLYVVYMYQKLLNFIDAFNCYKQKCKLAQPVNESRYYFNF